MSAPAFVAGQLVRACGIFSSSRGLFGRRGMVYSLRKDASIIGVVFPCSEHGCLVVDMTPADLVATEPLPVTGLFPGGGASSDHCAEADAILGGAPLAFTSISERDGIDTLLRSADDLITKAAAREATQPDPRIGIAQALACEWARAKLEPGKTQSTHNTALDAAAFGAVAACSIIDRLKNA